MKIAEHTWNGAWKAWLCCMLTGCVSLGVPTRRLSQDDFIRFYADARGGGDYWDYRGVAGGNHWLYHYGFKTPQQSVVSLIERGFIPAAELPSGFPSGPQPLLSPGSQERLQEGVRDFLKKGTGERPVEKP